MAKCIMESRSLKEVLEGLIDQTTTIILTSGQKFTVSVDAVIDDLLVVSACNKVVFIDINCICVVETCCAAALESLFNRRRPRTAEERDLCRFNRM